MADRLLSQLRSQLGPFGYQWLCACAVYPKLRFSLSTYIGAVIAIELERSRPSEDELLALFRLPWFRQGWLPQELRVRLVGDLDPRAAAAVRRAIERALFSVEVTDTDPTIVGPVALAEPPRRWRSMLRAYWDGASPDAAENDRIFIRYMNGRPVSPDALARQRWLERWLGRDVAALLSGGRALLMIAALAVVAGAATADSWLKPSFQTTVLVAAPPRAGGAARRPEASAGKAKESKSVPAPDGSDERVRKLEAENARLQRAADQSESSLRAAREERLRSAMSEQDRLAAEAKVRDLTDQRDRALARVREVQATLGIVRAEQARSAAQSSPSSGSTGSFEYNFARWLYPGLASFDSDGTARDVKGRPIEHNARRLQALRSEMERLGFNDVPVATFLSNREFARARAEVAAKLKIPASAGR